MQKWWMHWRIKDDLVNNETWIVSNHLFLSRNFINEIPIDQNNGYYLLLNDILLYVWDIFKSRDKNEYRLKFIELQVIEICIGWRAISL